MQIVTNQEMKRPLFNDTEIWLGVHEIDCFREMKVRGNSRQGLQCSTNHHLEEYDLLNVTCTAITMKLKCYY